MVMNSEAGPVDGDHKIVNWWKVVAMVVIAVAIASAVWYFTSESTPGFTTATSAPNSAGTIHLTYPADWTVTSATKVRGVPSNSILVLQRKDKSGVLVVVSRGQAPPFDATTTREINSLLTKEYTDYKFQKAAVIHLRGRRALFLTYLRTKQGDLHTITILPVGHRSFVIDTASPSANATLGVEIGGIIKSAMITSGT